MFRTISVIVLFVLVGCGVGSKTVIVNRTAQPRLSTIEIAAACVDGDAEGEQCRGEQILVASDTASPGLLTCIGDEIRRPRIHEVAHDPNTPFSIAAKVNVTRPNYRGEESQEHFPERCLEFQKRCHRQPGFNRCTQKAREIKSVSRRNNALRRCDRNFKTCTQVCVTVQKAYTVHRLTESCTK